MQKTERVRTGGGDYTVRYIAPHYYYVRYYSNGSRYIENDHSNYVKYKYDGEWDYPRIYYSYGYWSYVYVNDDSPTVSGDGVVLTGGAGNDTLIGGDGLTVNAGEGKDVISGFADDDLLQITDGFTTSYNASANTVSFKYTDGALTLKNFTATTFNVNGDSYVTSGKQLVK